MTRFTVVWGPAVLAMALIFIASSIPDLGRLPADLPDKSAHAAAYAVLGALIMRALAGARLSGVTPRRAALAILLTTLYGISDELHQMFVPGRSPDLIDIVADALGATVGVGAIGAAAVARAWGILNVDSLLAYEHPDAHPRESDASRR